MGMSKRDLANAIAEVLDLDGFKVKPSLAGGVGMVRETTAYKDTLLFSYYKGLGTYSLEYAPTVWRRMHAVENIIAPIFKKHDFDYSADRTFIVGAHRNEQLREFKLMEVADVAQVAQIIRSQIYDEILPTLEALQTLTAIGAKVNNPEISLDLGRFFGDNMMPKRVIIKWLCQTQDWRSFAKKMTDYALADDHYSMRQLKLVMPDLLEYIISNQPPKCTH